MPVTSDILAMSAPITGSFPCSLRLSQMNRCLVAHANVDGITPRCSIASLSTLFAFEQSG